MAGIPTPTRIVLVRHGRTALNAQGRLRGREDVPLDRTGEKQVLALAESLRQNCAIDQVISSPLGRAAQTARAIGAAFALAVAFDERLLDLDYGPWAGRTWQEVAATSPAAYREWRRHPHFAALPSGESLQARIALAGEVVHEVLDRYRGQTVALVTHEVVCQGLTCRLLGLPLRRFERIVHVPAAYSVFERIGRGWRVVCLDASCHLDGTSL